MTFRRWARPDREKTDLCGRNVCDVCVAPDAATSGPKTLDAGLAMVRQDVAWYRAYAPEQTPEARGQGIRPKSAGQARRAVARRRFNATLGLAARYALKSRMRRTGRRGVERVLAHS
jgi:ketosteroid isomerase-like protein